MVGDLVVLNNCQTSGYKDGTYGIIVKLEELGSLYSIYWILLPNDMEVPMWDSEFEVVDENWRSNNNS